MLFISSKFGICTVVGQLNVRILVSTMSHIDPRAVHMPNLGLIETKRITGVTKLMCTLRESALPILELRTLKKKFTIKI
jgi:hypothetical protein